MTDTITTLKLMYAERYAKLLKACVKHNRNKIAKHERKLIELELKIKELKEF